MYVFLSWVLSIFFYVFILDVIFFQHKLINKVIDSVAFVNIMIFAII